MAGSIHGDVAAAIGQQVEQMILQAKKDSEARVSHDLSVARNQLKHMENLLPDLEERVARCAMGKGAGLGAPDPSQTVDRPFLQQKISQLEQTWGSEVKALKQDLHRTILAHNHNSDLMRHHRDALDEARKKLDSQTQPKAEQVDAQIERVDKMLKHGQVKQRAMEQLSEKLDQLEIQVQEVLANAPMPPPFPPMMPGMPGMPPMMGQPPLGQQQPPREPAAKRAAKKDADMPTEEEFRARLLQAAGQGGDPSASHFNAEAPVFIPRSTQQPAEGGASKSSKAEPASPEPSGDGEGDEEDAGASGVAEGADAAAPAEEVDQGESSSGAGNEDEKADEKGDGHED